MNHYQSQSLAVAALQLYFKQKYRHKYLMDVIITLRTLLSQKIVNESQEEMIAGLTFAKHEHIGGASNLPGDPTMGVYCSIPHEEQEQQNEIDYINERLAITQHEVCNLATACYRCPCASIYY